MTPELDKDIFSWWDAQNFSGKELFKLEENGNVLLCSTPLLKERVIATVSVDNCDAVFKNLAEKFETLSSKVRETEIEWLAADDKLRMADKIEHLKENLSQVSALGDLEKIAQLINGWQQTIRELTDENLNAKTKLAEAAESLVESTNWKETAQAFKDIADKWKQAGHLDRGRNDVLWNRIEAARKAFHDRKRTHLDDEERDLMHNLDLKIELAEKAEQMAGSVEWKSTTEAFHNITEQWKAIGRTLPKKNEELWQRIMAAKSAFFDRKKVHFAHVQQEQEVNYNVKLFIVERAEALRDSTEWNNTALAYASLMEEWKKTGRVPHEKSEELWKRFTEAQEQFFDARRAHTEETRVAQESNYQLKSALLKRADEIKNSIRWQEATIEMNRLFDEWKKIGPVPREHNTSMWEAFLSARKHFFARKDANREQKKIFAETQKSARIEQAHSLVFKMQHEIEIEEEKLADFNNAIENITPGKKANELRSHLEILINDCTARIKRFKEKLAAAQDELKSVEEKEKTASGDDIRE